MGGKTQLGGGEQKQFYIPRIHPWAPVRGRAKPEGCSKGAEAVQAPAASEHGERCKVQPDS